MGVQVERVSVRFRLGHFIEQLDSALREEPDRIDDVVQTYKDFLSRAEEPLLGSVKKYISNHHLYTNNKRIKSFILACYK
jgi:hypothetical protein